MGGDHKCPVCQATFTRPQHVARHMRSHTGDRPYKCQYCGDQFARSDLLSRHVNKCHAGEKPANPSTTGRRKGSASASRATTSKQACDQCVQSSLPCDGSNPCAKCIQRKCRCTFVKFHRQTAPIGPGHNPRPQINSVSSRLPGYASADDFLLAPAPTSIAPIPGDPSSYNTSFTFPQLYPSTTDSAPPSLSMPPGDDYGKYRSQADYMRRQTLPFPSGPGVPPPDALYHDGRPSSATSWLGWGSHTTSQLAAGSRPPLVDEPKSDFHPAQSSSFTYPPVAADPYVGSYANRRLPQDRRTSVDFSSDSSHSIPSSAASSSVHLPLVDHQQQLAYHVSLDQLHEQIKDIFAHPRSSSSSAPGETLADTGSQDAQAQAHANFLQSHSSTSRPPGEDRSSGSPPNASDTHPPQPGEFSSAFGLMSLDDPAILAGLSNDGAPFFTDNGMDIYPGDPDATPMPPKPISKVSSHSIQTLSPNSTRDAETKELKDFWRQYLRTPFPGTTPQALGSANPMSASATPVSPGLGYRRARVSSLPTVQTPPTERSQFNYPNANAAAANANGATSSMRTTLHGNPDDLRSYEAAILARRAPLNLNLNIAPKRARGATASSTTSPMVVGMSADPMYEGSRPGSSSSVSSSLANAFGKQRQQQQQPQGGNVTFAYHTSEYGHGHGHGSATPPSRGSTASLEEGGSGERDALRPSFKRLPSQTLGPANSKRAMLDYDGDDSDVAEDDQHQYRFTTRSSSGSMHHPHPHAHHPPQQQQQHSPHHHHHHQQQQEQQPPGMNTGMMAPPPPSSMPSGNLANRRRRRMSAPDTSPTVPTFAAAGQL